MTLPRSPRPNYTQTLPFLLLLLLPPLSRFLSLSLFLSRLSLPRPSFVLHGPYYYKAVALIPRRPCAIHSASPSSSRSPLLPPVSQSFSSLRFLSRYMHGFSLSLSSFIGSPASKLKSKLAEDRGHYRVSIVRRRSVSTLLPRFPPTSLFFPFSFRYFYALARNISRASRVFTPSQENGLFSSRYLESNRRTDERGILKKPGSQRIPEEKWREKKLANSKSRYLPTLTHEFVL